LEDPTEQLLALFQRAVLEPNEMRSMGDVAEHTIRHIMIPIPKHVPDED
jgi:hypothetical protein